MPPRRLISEKQIESIGGIKMSFINKLTPNQIENYIENNVTNLATAKTVLKKLAVLVYYLAKHSNLQ
jgi:hypothetical protein